MLKKNDKVCVEITDYTDEGLGVGKAVTDDGTFTLFVKDTAVGDRAEVLVTGVKKSFGYGRLLSVLTPSPDRNDPECPVASGCGGCTLRHISYEAQLKWKEKRVRDCMKRIGGMAPGKDFELFPVKGMDKPYRYRNKAQYPVGLKDGCVVTGFYAGRTHSVIASEDCLIEPEGFGKMLKLIREFAGKNNITVYDESTGKGILRHVLMREGMGGDEIMVCLVVNAAPGHKSLSVFERLSSELKGFPAVKTFLMSHNTLRTNVILGEKETVLFGDGRIRDCIGGRVYEISARSFYQVNPLQTKVLYDTAAEYAGLTGTEMVWDLYCGTGTIGLYLADKAKTVYGVEIVERAVEDAKRNAELNRVSNAAFACGKAEDILISADVSETGFTSTGSVNPEHCRREPVEVNRRIHLPPPDVIVIDPPRKGCDGKLLDTIAGSGAARVVYVSCNPATFARDAAVLAEKGYRLECLQPVDMFPHTTGVEVVALFTSNEQHPKENDFF